jgi:hypothetical protein
LDKELNLDRLSVSWKLGTLQIFVHSRRINTFQIPFKLWYGKDKAKAQISGP